jgi:hypothetical protein
MNPEGLAEGRSILSFQVVADYRIRDVENLVSEFVAHVDKGT